MSLFKKKQPKIKSYKIEGDQIVVNYGWFKKERIANTAENIKNLNTLMKQQIMLNSADTYRNNKKGTVKSTFIGLGVTFGLSLLSAPLVILAIPALISAFHLHSYLYNSYKEYKASKMEFFLKNEEDFNAGIKPTDTEENTLAKTEKVSKGSINRILEEKEHKNKNVFDVNSVRKMSYNSLLNLRENLIYAKYGMTREQALAPEQKPEGPVLALH